MAQREEEKEAEESLKSVDEKIQLVMDGSVVEESCLKTLNKL